MSRASVPFQPPPPRRVVSLVPSLTETLFALGLGERVVAVTDYCLYPKEALAHLPRIGGTKNPNLDRIVALRPDLVLAYREENTPQAVFGLWQRGIPVWVLDVRTVDDVVHMLRLLAARFFHPPAADRATEAEHALLRHRLNPPRTAWRYFVPIWQDETRGVRWWMTFNRHTYMHSLLAVLGGVNIFAHRSRRYPLAADLGLAPPQDPKGRDTRYPRVTLEEIRAGQPEVILLPTEPYPYTRQHVAELRELLADTPAARSGRIYLVEGSLLTWPGIRMLQALETLHRLLTEEGI